MLQILNPIRNECSASTLDSDSSGTSDLEVASDSEKQYTNEQPKLKTVKEKSNQMRLSLKTLANTRDRCMVYLMDPLQQLLLRFARYWRSYN